MGKNVAPSDDIGYHYALDCYGNIFDGRDIRFKGENVHNYNTGVIGVVLLENLTDSEEGGDGIAKVLKFLDMAGLGKCPEVPDKQENSINKFIEILRAFFYIHTLGGHREFPGQPGEGKICPGQPSSAYRSSRNFGNRQD